MTTGGLPGHLTGTAHSVHPASAVSRAPARRAGKFCSLLQRSCKLWFHRTSWKVGKRQQSIQSICHSAKSLVNHTGHSCRTETLISLLHLQHNESFSNTLTRSLINTLYIVCLVHPKIEVWKWHAVISSLSADISFFWLRIAYWVASSTVNMSHAQHFLFNRTITGERLLVPATELGRGNTREQVPCMWWGGRGLLGAGGVLGPMMSVLGKASSGWTVRLSLVGPEWRSSLARPIVPLPAPRSSSFVRTSLEMLRSSFSEELVMVAEQHR